MKRDGPRPGQRNVVVSALRNLNLDPDAIFKAASQSIKKEKPSSPEKKGTDHSRSSRSASSSRNRASRSRLFADDAGDVARWRRVEGAAS